MSVSNSLYEMKTDGFWKNRRNHFLQAFFTSSGNIPYFIFDAVSIYRNNCFLRWQPLSAVAYFPDPLLNLLEALVSCQIPNRKQKKPQNKTTKQNSNWKLKHWVKRGETYSGKWEGVAAPYHLCRKTTTMMCLNKGGNWLCETKSLLWLAFLCNDNMCLSTSHQRTCP